MKISQLGLPLLATGLLVLTSCGTTPVAQPTSTAPPPSLTPILDPCSPENVSLAVRPINNLMLQFDDYATLASNADKSQLILIIPNMQTMGRLARGRAVPECMAVLQKHQIAYMDATLLTLLEFQKPDPKAGAIATGIVEAQYFHQEYALELARLLGVTVTPPAATPAVTSTP